MDYLGRVICQTVGGTGGGPVPINPFNQPLNIENDVKFQSVLAPQIHVGPTGNPVPLYTLPVVGPSPSLINVLKSTPGTGTVWKEMYDQEVNTFDAVEFVALDCTTVSTETLRVTTNLVVDNGLPNQSYILPLVRPPAAGCLLVSTPFGAAADWTPPPAYTTLYYTHPLGIANSLTNLWGTWNNEDLLPLPDTFPVLHGAELDFDTTFGQGLTLIGPAGRFEATVSLSLECNPLVPEGTRLRFALADYNGVIVIPPAPTSTNRSMSSRLGHGDINTNVAFTTILDLATNQRIWLGLTCAGIAQASMDFWVRSLIIRVRRVLE